jgi:hypothetical protein
VSVASENEAAPASSVASRENNNMPKHNINETPIVVRHPETQKAAEFGKPTIVSFLPSLSMSFMEDIFPGYKPQDLNTMKYEEV